MYSSAGKSYLIGRSSSRARSRTPPRTEEFEEADRTIKHLKRELEGLRGESRGAIEIRGKISNLEHRYEIMVQERHAENEGNRLKDLQLEVEITQVADDMRQARDQLNSKEREVSGARGEFMRLEKFAERIEDDLSQTERRLKAEIQEYEKLISLKAEFEHEKGNVINDQLKCNSTASSLTSDIEAISDVISKSKRKSRELRNQLIDIRSQIASFQKECNQVDEDTSRALFNQKARESTFKRLSDKAEGIRADCESMIKEKNNLIELYNTKDDMLRALGDTKAEHSRREVKLNQEKLSVNAGIADADRELAFSRAQANELEAEGSEKKHELSNLKKFYQKLSDENRKLIDTLRNLEQGDQKASAYLNREEKIENVINETNREISATLALIRG